MASAEPPTDVSSSGQESGPWRNGDAASGVNGWTSLSNITGDMSVPAFQAVNARSVGGGGTASPAAPLPPPINSSGNAADPPSDSRTTSNPPLALNTEDGDLTITDVATYGTRSRNRAGNARPNYAEDQDMEFDFGTTITTKKKLPPADALAASQAVSDVKRADGLTHLTNGSSKESTPVTSAAPAAASKKRKAIGGAPQQSNTSPAPAVLGASASRKPTTVTPNMARETNVMSFVKHRNCLNKKGELIADDGTKLVVNDHVYLVCEPPGDPYYLCRVMEFLHVDSDNPNSPVDSLRVNWYYRPRDVQRFNSDTRLVYGTMHSDTCPLSSLRGKCMIKHRSEIEDLEAYRKERDSFYFVQVFDRFIRRWYECIPVAQIINVPEKVKKALDERWKFVVVEIGRVKELTSAVKTCKRCARYCASHESVECAICKNSYHMNCVQPPLPKKPSRGFAWACGPCSRASEKKQEARLTPTISGDVTEAEEEPIEDEEQPGASSDSTRAPSPTGDEVPVNLHPATAAEIALAKMWPMRYLGIHCRVEDALQYDDRAIYPRASSRLGPRHQANVNMWHGRPVELVKPADIKKRYNKANTSHKKDGKFTKETIAALEADREERARRPKWVQDEPPGYVARGEDFPADDPRCTAKLLYKMPETGPSAEREAFTDDFVKKAKVYARGLGVPPFGVNFLDKALELLTQSNYNVDIALNKLKTMDRKRDLHEPILTKGELAKFEEGVAKYGSEHRLIRLHMKTHLPNSDIVRFYYLWKKTPKGREIWGNYGGRKGSKRKVESDAGAKLQAEVLHDGDDSAFDNDKAIRRNRGFICKFCNTMHSRQWRKAPFVSAGQTVAVDSRSGGKEKKDRMMLALCLRCAGLWRKYAIQWEDVDEVAKKVAQGGGRALKRRIDEELLRELLAANDAANLPVEEPPAALPSIETSEPPKKKSKTELAASPIPEPPKKKLPPPPPPKEPTPPPPPIVPTPPQLKVLPCAVCRGIEDTVACAHCKLTVHRRCFGLKENEGLKQDGSVYWVCEQCQNDRLPEVSTDYACCLCLTEETLVDLVEPPKVSHKKKTDREREKERMEKELADAMRAEYRNKQLSMNYPLMPREPLKRTTGNNWMHVYCAVWTPEIRFSNAQKLELAEGFQNIPPARFDAVCKLCKNKDHSGKVREDAGACISCFQCNANFHASCAFEAGYQFGFDVTPVKGSRKDQITTVSLVSETGSVIAAVWCKEHAIKTMVHPMHEVVDESGRTALQVFVENYKQADLTLTGTVRKANLVQLTKDKGQQAALSGSVNGRRESTAHSIAAAVRRGARNSSVADAKSETGEDGVTQISEPAEAQPERQCAKCKIDVTPRWHAIARARPPTPPRSPIQRRLSMTLGEYADLERERSNGQNEMTIGGDTTSAPNYDQAIPAPLTDPMRSQQIRFMPPGADGRTWNRRPDMDGVPHGQIRPGEQAHVTATGTTHIDGTPMPQLNGESGPPNVNDALAEDYRSHAMASHGDPAVPTPPPEPSAAAATEAVIEEFLCHKCFIKRKLNPTPSPQPVPAAGPAPPTLSPPRQFPLHLGWTGPPGGAVQSNEAPSKPPWEELPRSSQPPAPPHMNGTGPPPPAYSNTQPIPQGSGYPPYGQQPNGYHIAPQHPPPAAGPTMHERQPSYGYGPPLPGPQQQPYNPAQRPSPLPTFPLANQPMPNSHHSPHGSHAPLQSPAAYPPPLQQYRPRRPESPVSTQLPPIGQPLHSSPQASFTRPQDPYSGPPPVHQPPPQYSTAPPMQAPTQPTQPPTTEPQNYPPPAPMTTPYPEVGPPAQHQGQQTPQPQQASPTMSQARADGQGMPTTPRDGQSNGVQGMGGASASPSLRNLLH
ncbi:hypothetical protein BAUCODRAFT_540188 [Baudoinia panamericana UAMH 10762]|uniref:PHD finger and BAH domain protein n=1 Tax=Baudoinia panamericana (strain UAMH 10762) TaxID=717646 RepID=M2N9A6_BAUPA|nr:uncharacterized protein BAUCODRAFT_540188 [Baudoinia panamericana UAMH 10762]EMC95400.1 hypothetical protein BAUCODRAFT_540188 [Baudoinia panamericana UAMH 10762]